MVTLKKINDLPIQIKITGAIFGLLLVFLSAFLMVNNSVVNGQLESINSLVLGSLEKSNQETSTDLNRSLDVTMENMNDLGMAGVTSLIDLLALVSPEAILKNEFLALTNYSKAVTEDKSIVFAIFFANNGRPLSRYLDSKNPIVQRLIKAKGRNKIERLINGARVDQSISVIEKPIEMEGVALATIIVGIDRNYIRSKSVVIEELNSELIKKNLGMAKDLEERVASGFLAVSSKLLQFGFIANIIGLAIISALMYFLIGIITKPVITIVSMLRDIAEGEGDLTVRLDVNSKDELGDLAKWFNVFLEKLHGIISRVKNSAKEVANAGNEISTASEQMAAGAEEQQAQLSEVATSIEEMSAMILETSNNAEQTQGNASEANVAAEKGRGTVDQTIIGIEGIASIVDSASQQISTLKVRSQEIADVIQVIDDISDQTNLLALNANIEAARAGEAGRGFAVVADEVRKLAERTVGATADIEEKIKQIQVDVNASVEAMEQITEQSVKGQSLAGEAGKALGEISGSIDQVNGAITQIASAAIEQSAGVEEISKNVESVSTVSKQSASSAQELAASSEQLNREVQALDKLMEQFKV